LYIAVKLFLLLNLLEKLLETQSQHMQFLQSQMIKMPATKTN